MVTASNPYIDKFHYFSGNLSVLVDQLKAENFDFIVDLHNNIRSLRIRKALKKECTVVNKLNIRKFLLNEFSIDVMPGRHITTRSLDTLKPLGVTDDGLGLDYFIPTEDKVTISDIPTSHHAGYIVYVCGATYQCKKLPLHKMKEMCAKINHPIILIGGKNDADEAAKVAAVDPVKIYNACGKFNINESAWLVKDSKLVIAHDTGFQYIACAFQKPVIALWGCTSPRLGFGAYYGERFLQKKGSDFYIDICLDLYCQPCSKGTNHCPLEHFHCMEKISIDKVVQEVHRRLYR